MTHQKPIQTLIPNSLIYHSKSSNKDTHINTQYKMIKGILKIDNET